MPRQAPVQTEVLEGVRDTHTYTHVQTELLEAVRDTLGASPFIFQREWGTCVCVREGDA